MHIEELFPQVEVHVPAQKLSTFGVGKGASWVLFVKTRSELSEAIRQAQENSIPFIVLGGGSNVIFPDIELEKLIIVNEAQEIKREGNEIEVSSGMSLATLIEYAMDAGLGGLEALSGIPGSVGGAIVGNAGAYGQTISDTLTSVFVHDGAATKVFTKNQCVFSYRESVFKKEFLYVLSARFLLEPRNSEELKKKSREILSLREEKYPPDLKCPGSFFKNILPEDVSSESLAKINKEKIKGGKIPTGYLLEEIGACGMREGGIYIADYHGNLFINDGTGTCADVQALSEELSARVHAHFGITLSPEVRFVK